MEDTTSIAFLVPEFERFQQTEDFFVKVKSSRSLDGLVLEQGFGAEDAKLAGEALKTTLDMEMLDAGFVVALRGFRESAALPGFRLMQVSVYAEQTYLGSVARADDGGFVSGADPWVTDDLFNYSGEEESDDEPQATVPAARRHLLDRRAQQRADRRDRRGDHAPVAQPGSQCLHHA